MRLFPPARSLHRSLRQPRVRAKIVCGACRVKRVDRPTVGSVARQRHPQQQPTELPLFFHLVCGERAQSRGTILPCEMSYYASGSWLVELSANRCSRMRVRNGIVAVNTRRTQKRKGKKANYNKKRRSSLESLPAAERESDQRPGDDIPPSPIPLSPGLSFLCGDAPAHPATTIWTGTFTKPTRHSAASVLSRNRLRATRLSCRRRALPTLRATCARWPPSCWPLPSPTASAAAPTWRGWPPA